MDKYKSKYRIQSTRAQWWDYGWNGAYFITICTKNREHFFGEIADGKMILSNAGIIADIFWHEISNHFLFVELGKFVVMPNHIHGILILDKPDEGNGNNDNIETGHVSTTCPVSTTTINRANPISKYWYKYNFINHWFIQIGRYQTCQSFGFE